MGEVQPPLFSYMTEAPTSTNSGNQGFLRIASKGADEPVKNVRASISKSESAVLWSLHNSHVHSNVSNSSSDVTSLVSRTYVKIVLMKRAKWFLLVRQGRGTRLVWEWIATIMSSGRNQWTTQCLGLSEL